MTEQVETRKLLPIPIAAAKQIAKEYGYDQVIIYGRRCGNDPEPNGEHVTTYGVNSDHCHAAADIGDHLKYNVFGWTEETKYEELPADEVI